VIVQMGLAKLPELPDVPSALELVSDPVKHQVLELILMRQEIGRPVAAPPGVPTERLEVLRRAFDETMRDPEFLAEAEKLQLEIEPLSAHEIDALLANAFATPKPIVAQAAELIEPSAQK
jgi:tripartite-type tricarboxylate transporter receptor subunit TctC